MKKKIAIVTVYNSPNYGAFLQAYALKVAVEKVGNEVVFLNTHSRNPDWIMFLKMLKKVCKEKQTGKVIAYYSKCARLFKQIASRFQVIENSEIQDCDNVIFGSDEIWNISRRQVLKYPIFWGEGVCVEDKASYAISINNASEEDFYKYTAIQKEIKKFKVISVRDSHSQEVLKNILRRDDVFTVLDPTMLHSKEFYQKLMKSMTLDKFVLIYSYGNFISDNIKIEIRKYAEKKSLKIVSVLEYADWCDLSLVVDPFELLWLFENAETVFTDTFHGTVFSIIFEKQFKVISEGSKKVKEILGLFEIENKVMIANGDLETAMKDSIQYKNVIEVLERERKKSWQVLLNILHDEK